MSFSPLYFDALTRIGPRPSKSARQPWNLNSLIEDMEHASISAALVQSILSVRYDPIYSNRELSRQLEEFDQLFPVWNLLPHGAGESPEPAELEKMLADQPVAALSIHPNTNGWDALSDSSRELFAWLEDAGRPVLMGRSEFGKYGELETLLQRFPRLPLILTDASWREQRQVLPLVRRFKNLHLCFNEFQVNYGIEDLVEFGCEDQLLFGSNAPVMSAGAHRTYVDYAEVTPEVKTKIASGNLLRLLKLSQPPHEFINPDEDVLMREARQGLPLSAPVIDMHMHILHEGLNGVGATLRMSKGGPKPTFAMLKRLGCVGGGFMSWNGTYGADAPAGNLCVTDALDAAPTGYWGLATLDPVHYSQDEMRTEMLRAYSDPRFIGMKPYVFFGVEYHSSVYDQWWEFGNERQFYAGIHRVRDGDFLEIETLAAKYPRVRWVAYHCGSDFKTAEMAVECMQRHPNVFAEITFTSVASGIIEYLVSQVGADRVLYGSDLPMRDPRQQLGWVVYSKLPVEEKIKILGANAMQVIAPCRDRLPAHSLPQPFFP